MFIVDDLVLAPAKGFMWLVRELRNAADREFADERERTMRALQTLHMRLEAGQIDEATFEEQETELLDRLDHLDGLSSADEPEPAADTTTGETAA
ncbi:MAG: gas vesicle protein GvpG [Planctomycetota bacterium]